MSHHSTKDALAGIPKELMDAMRQDRALDASTRRFEAEKKSLEEALGPTGEFPAGKIVPHDEGGLMFGITTSQGRVVLDFGKPIRSIGFTRNDALDLARILKTKAKQLPPIIGEKLPQ